MYDYGRMTSVKHILRSSSHALTWEEAFSSLYLSNAIPLHSSNDGIPLFYIQSQVHKELIPVARGLSRL